MNYFYIILVSLICFNINHSIAANDKEEASTSTANPPTKEKEINGIAALIYAVIPVQDKPTDSFPQHEKPKKEEKTYKAILFEIEDSYDPDYFKIASLAKLTIGKEDESYNKSGEFYKAINKLKKRRQKGVYIQTKLIQNINYLLNDKTDNNRAEKLDFLFKNVDKSFFEGNGPYTEDELKKFNSVGIDFQISKREKESNLEKLRSYINNKTEELVTQIKKGASKNKDL